MGAYSSEKTPGGGLRSDLRAGPRLRDLPRTLDDDVDDELVEELLDVLLDLVAWGGGGRAGGASNGPTASATAFSCIALRAEAWASNEVGETLSRSFISTSLLTSSIFAAAA